MLDLQERLYTSTEVAEILGVSLRSVYRYLEEGKLNAEVKTATGRHRFTRKNILDFLYPDGKIPAQTQQFGSTPRQQVEPSNIPLPPTPPTPPAYQDTQFIKTAPQTSEVPVSSQVTKPGITATPFEQDSKLKDYSEPKVELEPAEEKEPVVEEEPIDWLAKFREAAKKFREEEDRKEKPSSVTEPDPFARPVRQAEPKAEPRTYEDTAESRYERRPEYKQEPEVREDFRSEPAKPRYRDEPAFAQDTVTGLGSSYKQDYVAEKEPVQVKMVYYKSGLGGLKDIAQNIDKVARNSEVDYAFTLNAGLSLFKPIKPFSILHIYIRPEDRDFFEKMLRLTPASEDESQLCMIMTKSSSIFSSRAELHGLFVVSKEQLLADIKQIGDSLLAEEAKGIIG